jgi:hypothetical protein
MFDVDQLMSECGGAAFGSRQSICVEEDGFGPNGVVGVHSSKTVGESCVVQWGYGEARSRSM